MNVLAQLPKSDPQYAVLKDFDGLFRKEYGRAPIHFGAHAWDAIQLLRAALAKVGPDPARLREELEGTRGFVGAGGIYNFSTGDHNGMSKDAFVLIRVVNGEWALVK
jgi:branched-chain amino acid transport system substrate-binding protein